MHYGGAEGVEVTMGLYRPQHVAYEGVPMLNYIDLDRDRLGMKDLKKMPSAFAGVVDHPSELDTTPKEQVKQTTTDEYDYDSIYSDSDTSDDDDDDDENKQTTKGILLKAKPLGM